MTAPPAPPGALRSLTPLSSGAMTRFVLPLLTALALLVAGPLSGQLITDRPNFVEASTTVGPGVFQLETGVILDRDGDLDIWSTPILLRFGIADAVELRLETPGYVDVGDPFDQEGLADVAVGAKWNARSGADGGPSLGALLHLDLPLGSSALRQDGVRPSLRGVAEWAFDDGIGLGVMAGIRSDRQGDDRFTSGLLGAAVTKAWNPEVSTYGELAVTQIAEDRYGGDPVFLNTGVLLLVNTETQLDLGLSFGLNDEASEFGLTVGFSRRLGYR